MRLAKVVILVIALAGLAVPAAAVDCATGSISWETGSPAWAPETVIDGVNTAVVGTYLWAQYFVEEPVDEYDGTVSIEIPADASAAQVCADGTVTFQHSPGEASDPDNPHSEPSIDLVEMWADYLDLTPRLRLGAF